MATSSPMSTSNAYIKYTISVEENSQNAAGNYSSVTVSVRFYRTNSGYSTYGSGTVACIIDGIRYTSAVTSSQKITASGIVLFKKTVNVYHDEDGFKDLTCLAAITHSQFHSNSQSYTQTLTRILRHSSLDVAAGTLGEAQTLKVVQNNPDYVHTIKYTCGSVSGTICENSSETSIEFIPPVSLASQNPTGTTVSIKYEIESFENGESVGIRTHTAAYTIPESAAPTCELSVSDENGFADQFGDYIQGKSALSLLVTPSKAYGAEIVAYSISVDGATYTAENATTDVLKNSGELTITATVTDQRNRTGTAKQTISVLEYAAPMISGLKVGRCNANGASNSSGTYAKVTFSNEVTALNDRNTAAYTLQYRKITDTSFTTRKMTAFEGVYSNNGATYIITSGLDTSATYEIILTVEDAFGSVSKTATCPSASKLWSILRKGLGFAFGKVAELEGVFEVAFQTKLTGGILHPVPGDETDLDTLTTPNTFRLLASNLYTNAPEAEVDAILKVTGDANALRQRFNVIDKVNPRAYERAYSEGEWGAWIDLDAFMLSDTNASIASMQTAIRKLQNEMMLAAYPVGSIYMSLNETSPADLFGGTWEQIQDRFLLASGERNAGGTGGSEFIEFNLPEHTHTISTRDNVAFQASAVTEGKYNIPITGTTNVSGEETAIVWNMPPYLAVHMWKRVADPVPEDYEEFIDVEGNAVLDAEGNEIMVKKVG